MYSVCMNKHDLIAKAVRFFLILIFLTWTEKLFSLFKEHPKIYNVTLAAMPNAITVSVKRRLRTADCGPGVKCRLRVKCRQHT